MSFFNISFIHSIQLFSNRFSLSLIFAEHFSFSFFITSGGVVFWAGLFCSVFVIRFFSYLDQQVILLGFIVDKLIVHVFIPFFALTAGLSSETVKKTSRPFVAADKTASAPNSLIF